MQHLPWSKGYRVASLLDQLNLRRGSRNRIKFSLTSLKMSTMDQRFVHNVNSLSILFISYWTLLEIQSSLPYHLLTQ